MKKEVEAEAVSLDARWRKVCSETLVLVSRNRDAWIFKEPVIESPELTHEAKVAYTMAIAHPMDFRTVRKNISAYVSPAEFESDMLLVFKNCLAFNKPGQDAFEMGKDVENVFLARWELERRKEIAQDFYMRSKQLADSVGSDVLETSRRSSKVLAPFYDAETKTVVTPPHSAWSSSGSQSPQLQWREIITNLVTQIKEDPSMVWFLKPVHSYAAIPVEVRKKYYALIKNPMDLSTVEKNLPLYPSPDEFRKDMELIVTNSIRFNPPGSPVNAAALEMQSRISKTFDETFKPELGLATASQKEWGKGLKKFFPDPTPSEFLEPPAPTVLRLKRTRTSNSEDVDNVPPEVPARQAEEAVAKTVPTSNILQVERAMVAMPAAGQNWRAFASHCLHELNQIKDETSNTKLAWIFQRPLFKYELPVGIKRLYLLSISDLVDLSLISEKLNTGVYDAGNGPADFEADMLRMLDNCLVFNDESQYPHKVGFVLKKHFIAYWTHALKKPAVTAWESSPKINSTSTISREGPDWDDIRRQVEPDVVRPNQDCDSMSASFPLNDELLYEWRVSQRFVMQEIRTAKLSQN